MEHKSWKINLADGPPDCKCYDSPFEALGRMFDAVMQPFEMRLFELRKPIIDGDTRYQLYDGYNGLVGEVYLKCEVVEAV